jgi:cytoskeleton protein RodZ
MQGSLIGVGPALRKARTARRTSLEEASRDTHIRSEYLEALEREMFWELNGEVYVRGCLRSYATYLGLNPDKVVAAYARNAWGPVVAEELPPAPPAKPLTNSAPVIRRARHGVAFGVGSAVLLAAVIFGLVSRNDPARAPLAPSPDRVVGSCATTGVSVAITPKEALNAKILADGEHVFTGRLRPGETKTWVGDNALTVRLSRGGGAMVSVDCSSLGLPGTPGQPWEETFTGPEGGAGVPGVGGASSTPA